MDTRTEKAVTPIGKTDWRNTNRTFGIKDQDRLRHFYVLGKTGVGKSTLLANMAIADIQNGKGTCVIDPHGDIAEQLLDFIPPTRIQDVIYFNAADGANPLAYNPLYNARKSNHHLLAAGLVASFKKIWSDSWGPRMEYILQFALLTLLDYPNATLLDIQPLLVNKDFRFHVLRHVTNTDIHSFWNNEFDKYPYAVRIESINPILNKTGTFITNTPLRNIIHHKVSSFDIKDVIDSGKILICNLAKGVIGDTSASLLGSMLLTSIQLAAMQRASMKEEDRKRFFLYIDEMHSFTTQSFIDVLAESRKYGLSLFLTHQYIDQIDETIRAAIIGNVGTIIVFRIGSNDALTLKNEFYPPFDTTDLINLPNYKMYLKLMIDGTTSKPFSAQGLPLSSQRHNLRKNIVALCREKYSKEIPNYVVPKRDDYTNTSAEQPTLFE